MVNGKAVISSILLPFLFRVNCIDKDNAQIKETIQKIYVIIHAVINKRKKTIQNYGMNMLVKYIGSQENRYRQKTIACHEDNGICHIYSYGVHFDHDNEPCECLSVLKERQCHNDKGYSVLCATVCGIYVSFLIISGIAAFISTDRQMKTNISEAIRGDE